MTDKHPTALIADDEPLLRTALVRMLEDAWPELKVVAQARNGRDAVEQFESLKPDICFLDVHMPGISGVEAARQIGRRSHLVFVTAYNQYAVRRSRYPSRSPSSSCSPRASSATRGRSPCSGSTPRSAMRCA